MRKFFTLLAREIKSFFYSPIAYVVLCFFLLITGFTFYVAVTLLNESPSDVSLIEASFNTVLFWITFILVFALITMRTFSEEFRMGTIESLMTAPVGDLQVVLAKYFGALFFYVVLWLPSLLYFVAFQYITRTSAAHAAGSFWGTYLLLLLMGMFFISIGCLSSALTKNQIIAAVVCFAAITLFFFAGLLSYIIPSVTPEFRELLGYVSTVEHMREYSKGIIDSRPMVLYLSGTVLMLAITFQVFQIRKWKA